MIRKLIAISAVGSVAALAACGSSGTSLTSSNGTSTTSAGGNPVGQTTTTSVTVANYHPKIDPKQFTSKVTNPYFPLPAGRTYVLKGKRDGAPTLHRVQVTHSKRKILGVDTAVIRDTVTSNGNLIEKTSDWYAQNTQTGDVWYFGEQTAEYANGIVTNTEGSWEAGVDGAQPGIVMHANPKPGPFYRQEYRPGIAEDMAKVLQTGLTLHIGNRTFNNVIVTNDKNPLDPSLHEKKWYAKGYGTVQTIRHQGGHVETSHFVK